MRLYIRLQTGRAGRVFCGSVRVGSTKIKIKEIFSFFFLSFFFLFFFTAVRRKMHTVATKIWYVVLKIVGGECPANIERYLDIFFLKCKV